MCINIHTFSYNLIYNEVFNDIQYQWNFHLSETDLNFLMSVALDKIAFLPFAMVIDRYRWDVFDGTTKPQDYAKHWWELRFIYIYMCPILISIYRNPRFTARNVH